MVNVWLAPMKIESRSISLTQKTIRAALASREGRRQTISDRGTPGLVLVVNPTSARWEFRWRPRGKTPDGKRYPLKSVTIGSPETHSLADARGEAGAMALKAARGDLVAARAKGSTVDAHIERYLGALIRKKGDTQYTRDQSRNLRAAFAGYGDRDPAKIGRADFLTMLDPFHDRPDTHRHTFGAVSRFLSDLVARDAIPFNPAADLDKENRPVRAKSRDRYLNRAEVDRYLAAARGIGGVKGAFALMVAYIPARRGELAGMTWAEVDLNAHTWTLRGTRTKNGEPHRFPLHDRAVVLLRTRRRATGDTGLVFPSEVSGGPLSGWSQLKRRIDKAGSLSDWTWHDWRRTFVTHLAERGHDEPVLDALINHKQSATRGGVLGVYNVSERWDDRVRAMHAWDRFLRHADAENVVPFAQAQEAAH